MLTWHSNVDLPPLALHRRMINTTVSIIARIRNFPARVPKFRNGKTAKERFRSVLHFNFVHVYRSVLEPIHKQAGIESIKKIQKAGNLQVP